MAETLRVPYLNLQSGEKLKRIQEQAFETNLNALEAKTLAAPFRMSKKTYLPLQLEKQQEDL